MSRISFNDTSTTSRIARGLGTAERSVRAQFAKLSTGLRITKAADDAAGLSISSSAVADRRVLEAGRRNLNDIISAADVASSAVSELQSVITRIRELSIQSANGVLGSSQRTALDAEAQSLVAEYNRILEVTKFNDIELLGSDMNNLEAQAGYSVIPVSFAALQLAGNGQFTASSIPTNAGTPFALAIGDFNGDGLTDYVTSTAGANGTVKTLIADGSGGFVDGDYSVTNVGAGGANLSVGVGDFDGDGRDDLIFQDVTTDQMVTVLHTAGGPVETRASGVNGWNDGHFEIADLNADGASDVVFSDLDGIHYRYGNGDGTFGANVDVELNDLIGNFLVHDVNDDGELDIVGVSLGVNVLNTYLNDGSDGFAKVSISVPQPYAIALGDYDKDGHVDAAFVSYTDNNLHVHRGDGAGNFSLSGTAAGAAVNRALATTDLNGDGNLDIVTSDQNDGIGVFYGSSTGEFEARSVAYSGFSYGMDVRDLNGDSVDDVVYADLGNDSLTNLTQGTSLRVRSLAQRPLSGISLRSATSALAAHDLLRTYSDSLGLIGAAIGSAQARMTTAAAVTATIAEELAQAASRITDADMAEEAATLVRATIQQQVAGALLAQAKRQPEIGLELLET